MSYSIKFKKNNCGVLIEFEGSISGEQIILSYETVYLEHAYDDLDFKILNFTKATRFNATLEQLKELAKMDRREATINPHQQVAFVGSEYLFGGLDLIYSIYTEVWSGFCSRRFLTVSDALKWVE